MTGNCDAADPFRLERFVAAQDTVYGQVVGELRAGLKRTHWMWFVFPQIIGLGSSGTAVFYSIRSLDEARAYLAHPVLGPRLRDCTGIVTALTETSAAAIFGDVDARKLRSSMTLFFHASGRGEPFHAAIAKFFGGMGDAETEAILGLRP